MSEHVLRDPLGRRLGVIREEGGRRVLRDPQGRQLGYHDPRRNETRSPTGQLLGYGDLLAGLLPRC